MYDMTCHLAPAISRPVPQPGDVLASQRSARSDIYEISVIPGSTQRVAGACSRTSSSFMVSRPPQLGLRIGIWPRANQAADSLLLRRCFARTT